MSNSIFKDFFREDAALVTDVLEGTDKNVKKTAGDRSHHNPKYHLPKSEPATEEEQKIWWRNLRTFYRTGKGGGILADKKTSSVYPALLAPYVNVKHVSSEYPFWMAQDTAYDKDPLYPPFSRLSELLLLAIGTFAPGEEQAALLKSNVNIVVNMVDEQLNQAPVSFRPLIDETLDRLFAKLTVKGDEGTAFTKDVENLKSALPQGMLIPLSHSAHLQLFNASLAFRKIDRRADFQKDLAMLIRKIRDILTVDQAKNPEATDPDKLRSSFDIAGSFIDFDKLSKVIPKKGSENMPRERFRHLSKLLTTLKNAESVLFGVDAAILVSKLLYEDKSFDWKKTFPGASVRGAGKSGDCKQLEELYDSHMAAMAESLAAIRMAKLEIEGHYDPVIHEDYYKHFDWRSFTENEMAICPPVILIKDVNSIMSTELSDFSHLLASGRAVRFLAIKQDVRTNYHENGSKGDAELLMQQELGALAVSHRNLFVYQGTLISPQSLAAGLQTGLARLTPGLFHLLAPDSGGGADRYLWTSAAVESREFPGFIYDSEKSMMWGGRFDVTNNPQFDADWPVYELDANDAEGVEIKLRIPFTFADFASQDPFHKEQFMQVPSEYWSDDLVPVSEYLAMGNEAAYAKVPFIWMTNKDHELLKVAVSYEIVLACRERLDFWHYLQDNGGVKSYHAQQAVEKLRIGLNKEKETEIEALKKEQEDALEKVRTETAGEAMERLCSFLLDMDAAVLTASPSPVTVAPVEEIPPTTGEEEKAPAGEPKAEASVISADPWIDTALCTSCNECIDLNPKLFKYNADKQATVADVSAGTFSDLVEAAEKCPAKVIHPGAPANKNEPDLDDLVKRAEQFN